MNIEKIVCAVQKNSAKVEQFLGYKNRAIPPVISKKITEELGNFGSLIEPQAHYLLHMDAESPYADILYSVGEKINTRINEYFSSGETMRGLILDKIAVVTLDTIKDELIAEIHQKTGYFVTQEMYPSSPNFTLEKQAEIFHSFDGVNDIQINEYHQLFPIKSVALRLLLSPKMKLYNRCESCQSKCEAALSDEENAYEFFLDKAQKYTKAKYSSLGLTEELFEDNIKDIEVWAKHYFNSTGKRGIDSRHFEWIDSILEAKVIKLGRLQFEVMDVVPIPLPENTLALNVHIRAEEDFSRKSCIESYQKAFDFYTKMNFEFERIAFFCDSWLLYPDLSKILPSRSNILQFSADYEIISVDQGHSQMEERVFGMVSENLDAYPAQTSLQNNLRQWIADKNSVGKALGYFVCMQEEMMKRKI